ncbi:Glycosyl transferase family 2 [Thermosyntropha lipolytica DSM 11003]|uniref:Glycosyl transferase family 2 n=1 Tax=Thermosyntropha lipolytica DSM 11003 TaxID=1123382 RepID=A0A1M5J838_9FIRM|nr:glycosyltransferase family 2 protein [Thermosyntropha lipolytica]SHG36747.1 Glycosyl transferase family 2 [Thermosyntropha lipolytica DSM 11003]
MRITAVIPAYNEGERIGATLEGVKKVREINRILVVNDGSTDDTAEKVKKAGVELLDLEVNRGKGGAMNAALPYLQDADIVVFLDGDLGETAAEASKIIKPVMEGEADLCIAAFGPPSKKGGFGLVKGTAAWIIKKTGNLEAVAPLSGQRAMTREVLEAVTPFKEAYGVELGMTLSALRKGFRVLEVPTSMRHNETGRDIKGFMHRGKQFIDVLKVIKDELRRK